MTLDLNMAIDPVVMAVVIPTIIAVTNGINAFFKIEDGNTKRAVTVIVTIAAYLSIVFKDSIIMYYLAPLVILLFGAAGIYNFIPTKKEPETIETIIRKNEER